MDILSGAGALLGRNKRLAPGLIETTRLRDANQQEPSKAVVQSVEFHPNGQLLLTAGLDKRLRLFQVSVTVLIAIAVAIAVAVAVTDIMLAVWKHLIVSTEALTKAVGHLYPSFTYMLWQVLTNQLR